MILTGDKWVIVYAHPDKGRKELLVKAGHHRVRLALLSEAEGFGVSEYRWDGSTRDAQGRRVYA